MLAGTLVPGNCAAPFERSGSPGNGPNGYTVDIVSSYLAETLLEQIDRDVIGLHREAEVLAVALAARRHVVLEGPPGTGKSTLLRSLAHAAGVGFEFVEGNAELTPSRLVGHHDPAIVLERGYIAEAFVPGPLAEALGEGKILYLEELNRIPEETLNLLITALAESEVHVPRYGKIAAHPDFRFVAAMNPFDAIGTQRVAQAIYDRLCRVAIGYQDESHEVDITRRVTGDDSELSIFTTQLVRATRGHRDLRLGSSVRGSIDMVSVAVGLGSLRHEAVAPRKANRATLLDAANAALSGRIRVDDGVERPPESIVEELLDELLERWDPAEAPGKSEGSARRTPQPPGQGRIMEGAEVDKAVADASRRTTSRSEMRRRHERFEEVSPEVGVLDEKLFDELLAQDPDEAVAMLADLATSTDPLLREHARRLAARVFIRLGQRTGQRARGIRKLVPQHRRPDGDLDIDRTIERAFDAHGGRPRTLDDYVVRRWHCPERAIALLIDRSGSMSGAQVAMAAVASASVVLHSGERADTSVIAFAKNPLVLQPQGQRRKPGKIVNDLMSLRGWGTTDISLALKAATAQLARSSATDRVAVLLSDCLYTEGTNPAKSSMGAGTLHVICTSDAPESVAAAAEIARAHGGRYEVATSIIELAPAISKVLGDV